ncbi:MAG: hypothetical protein GX537_02745 [Actinobacteria bacterium]|nr:hypothetical protein [Actinomycetota bacterium]
MTDARAAVPDTISEHVHCMRCGYDRFGSRRAGVCPECGDGRWTRHFRGRRRVRLVAAAILVLAGLNLVAGIGVRLVLYRAGVELSDFREMDGTSPLSPRALQAAPYLSLAVWHANALVLPSLVLAVSALAVVPFGVWFRHASAVWMVGGALVLIAMGGWLGLQAVEALGP